MLKKLPVMAGVCALVLVSGCTHKEEKTVVVAPPQPQVGSLTRSMDMVDADGKHYGRVEMDPVGGGKVYDSSGRLIGNIVAPER